MDVLKVVDKYYYINSITDTYCLKCDELEKNFICKKCVNININSITNDTNNINDKLCYHDSLDNILERFINLNIRLEELLLIIQEFRELINNFKM
tara:strand:+ start:284 stop:568 length:285 start_codon:yes stop_codon:yes gene_type:complete